MDCIVLGYIYKQKVGPTGAADHIYIYIYRKGYFMGIYFMGHIREYDEELWV